ncbi:5-hydroxyisourate hydrolase [Toxorhynchites rutilus septentrionalis]|uniref:5-hydroxyisourate hydrolase n=1 Tax=Toxorhynchites rutilus septentrionalis TaxID=329112 RepID=UPI002478DB44|nr:5-hydroxyisourate hydrolase [Toxorhynchites rutilus septentrionalis]
MGLSTHILDTSRGKPAANVGISLFRRTNGAESWQRVGQEGLTDSDGRYKGFFVGGEHVFVNGVYKLRFEVGLYYEQLKIDTLYPYVEIAFEIKDTEQHYHIPLLLNPYGYSTYRGS